MIHGIILKTIVLTFIGQFYDICQSHSQGQNSLCRIISGWSCESSDLSEDYSSFPLQEQCTNTNKSLVKKRFVILTVVWVGSLIMCVIKVILDILKNKYKKEPTWLRVCFALWYPVLGTFILCIAAICGYAQLWADFGIALTVGALLIIRGFFYNFENSPKRDRKADTNQE